MTDDEENLNTKGRQARVIVMLAVWVISIGYMGVKLKSGWVPHDEGTLGLSAERVLQGQLPHRDFDDYTGGLTFVHAAAFRIFGVSSMSMRYVLFAFFIAWIPTVFYIASKFGPPIAAGAVTLLAMTWSVPNYPGPMPSWYNLFFATAGIAALLRYVERRSRRLLVLAGFCGGLSFLAKITAAYYVAGVLLFFVFHEQVINREQNRGLPASSSPWYRTVVAVSLLTFLIVVLRLIRSVEGISGPIYFVLPISGLVVLLLGREFAGIPGQTRRRLAAIARLCVWFGFGLALSIFAFYLLYVSLGAADQLSHGLFVTSSRAIQFATFAPRPVTMMVSIIPFLILIVIANECRKVGRIVCGCLVGMYGVLLIAVGGKSTLVYNVGWCALGTSIPAVSLVGAAFLSMSRKLTGLDCLRQQQIMLMLSVTTVCSLVQFPFAAPIYFYYVAPLVILCLFALSQVASRPPKFVLAVILAIYLAFPMLPNTAFQMGISHDPQGKHEQLNIGRANGLRVDSKDASTYNRLIPTVQLYAKGKFIYAAPDCPEVYFLSGLQSPSRHYFDYIEESSDRLDHISRRLEHFHVNLVVISKEARFTGPLWPDVRDTLDRRYIHLIDLGAFEVRWKE